MEKKNIVANETKVPTVPAYPSYYQAPISLLPPCHQPVILFPTGGQNNEYVPQVIQGQGTEKALVPVSQSGGGFLPFDSRPMIAFPAYCEHSVQGEKCPYQLSLPVTNFKEKPRPSKRLPFTVSNDYNKSQAATPKAITPKATTPKPESPKTETPKPETPKPKTPKPETPKAETPKDTTPKESNESRNVNEVIDSYPEQKQADDAKPIPPATPKDTNVPKEANYRRQSSARQKYQLIGGVYQNIFASRTNGLQD